MPRELADYSEMDGAEYHLELQCHKAKLNKLTLPELRLLLIHFRFAEKWDVKTWAKVDAVEAIAEEFMKDFCP